MRKHLTDREKQEYKYLIELISSSVNGTEPPQPYEGIQWGRIAKLAEYCSCEALTADAVLRLEKDVVGDEVYSRFKRTASFQLVIDGNIVYEAEKILAAFEKYKVKNCPLKGYFMKNEYPRSDFRSMSDIDILYDKEQSDSVRKAFAEIGYDFVCEHPDELQFRKNPLPYVEMHSSLTREVDDYYIYLKDQLEHTAKRKGYEYSYEMSLEDFYAFLLIHSSAHCRMGGMGLRMVLDVYVFYKNHIKDFNFEYLNDRLQKMNIAVFEQRIREIAFNWFSGKNAVMRFDSLEAYILLSGTLGRADVGVMVGSQKQGGGKAAYLFSTLFPSRESQVYRYKYLKKAPFLLPFSWGQMWCRRIFIEKNVHVKRGIKNRLAYTDDDVEAYKTLMNELGFEGFGLN